MKIRLIFDNLKTANDVKSWCNKKNNINNNDENNKRQNSRYLLQYLLLWKPLCREVKFVVCHPAFLLLLETIAKLDLAISFSILKCENNDQLNTSTFPSDGSWLQWLVMQSANFGGTGQGLWRTHLHSNLTYTVFSKKIRTLKPWNELEFIKKKKVFQQPVYD